MTSAAQARIESAQANWKLIKKEYDLLLARIFEKSKEGLHEMRFAIRNLHDQSPRINRAIKEKLMDDGFCIDTETITVKSKFSGEYKMEQLVISW